MKTRKLPTITLSCIITLLIMLILYAVAGVFPFGTATTAFSDGFTQYVPFLSTLADKIREGGSLLYTWNMGSGTNFWAIISYYLASPLNLIAVFFSPDRMDDAFSLITLIKPVLMALTFAIYLKNTYKKNDLTVVAFSVLWAFSGFMICGLYITSWYDAIIYFPLVIMGLNKMMNGGSAKAYSLFLGLAIASNFYMGWMTCIFCVLYFVYSLLSDDSIVYEGVTAQGDKETEENDENTLNVFETIKNSYLLGSMFKFAFSSVLAGGISAVMTLPTVSALQETGKGTVTNATLNFGGDGIWGILASHIFPFKNNFTTLTTTECIFAFAGIVTLILAVAYFFAKGISARKKFGNLFLVAVMWVSMIFHDVWYAWHGFGEPVGITYRFAFIYSFVLLKIAYEAICAINNIKWYGILAGTAFAGLCVAGIYFNDVFNNYFFSAKLIITLVIFIVLFTTILLLMSKNVKAKSVLTIALLVCIITETVTLNFDNLNAPKVTEDLEAYDAVQEMTVDVADNETMYFASGNEDFDEMLMYGGTFNFRGLEHYSSMSDYHYALTVLDFGTYGNRLNMQNGANEQSPAFNMFFPISYYIDGTGHIDESWFREKVAEKDGYTFYKNNYTMPFMYAVSDTIVNWNPFDYMICIDNINEGVKELTGTTENIAVYNNPTNFIYENCTHISAVDRVEINQNLTEDNHNHESEEDHDHDHGDADYSSLYEFLEKRMNGYSYTITDKSKPAYITFDSVAEADGMMYLFVDTSEFTNLTVKLNGKTTTCDLYGVRDYTTYELGEVKKGDVATITIGGHRKGTLDDGNVYYLENNSFTTISYTIDKEKFENAYNTLDGFSDTELLEFDDTYVKAKVTSNIDGALYIPIAYDEGWQIFVDGVEYKLYEHNSHILMTGIAKGEHIIEMKYCPKGLVAGACITGVSVAILIAWAVISEKKKKSEV